MNATERRRATFAAVLSLIALPALWVLNRGEADNPGVPRAGAAGVDSPTAGAATPVTEYRPQVPPFIEGTPTPPAPPNVKVAVGTVPPGNHVTGRASYHRYTDGSANACTTGAAPLGIILTVTNLDNGQSVQCTNNGGWLLPTGIVLVLDTGLFALISDLADAPIPVSVSW